MIKNLNFGLLLMLMALVVMSCRQQERSSTTGWVYNDPEWGGFEKLEYEGQETGPNLVLIPGGTFTMGLTDEDVMFRWNATPRRVTVGSFYMDETEISNIDYREYIFWLQRVYDSHPEVVRDALPDTLVWREELAYNEPFVETYFRFPAYDNYPVVGVSWEQATRYAEWRTDRVNEMLLIERGILNPNPDQRDQDNFNTQAYLAGLYEGSVRENLPDLSTGGERRVRFEDGILLPSYRLPTEAEWEYAALALHGLQGDRGDELITDRRIYPWDGVTMRYQRRDRNQGRMLANYKMRGGDYMGVSVNLNDNAAIPAPVRSYMPNDFGLFNMAGNVSEWVKDVYRPLTTETLRDVDNNDLNPFRGNIFREVVRNEDGTPVGLDSLGRLQSRVVTERHLEERDNYNVADARDFGDDDSEFVSYEFGVHSLVNNYSRVIKGGSWADRAYWLSPAQRRFMDQRSSSRTVGFRCAMTRTGGPTGNAEDAGNLFGNRAERRFR
ncbi:MAG: gliding motility lipoprotein GldJ [Saprospirales bacterium]|nr:MAG: gliding motility lipoprotein GldJ [Saprospirales bacterium]